MYSQLLNKLEKKKITVGIVGLGYVGLPLARAFSLNKIKTIGFDNDKSKISKLKKGISYIKNFSNLTIQKMNRNNFECYNDFKKISNVDAIILCLPTPLKKNKSPEMKFINNSLIKIRDFLKEGQILSLESTTYPGTTDEVIEPILKKKFKIGKNFFLVYSPEREDPGNKNYSVQNIPKILGGYSKKCQKIGIKLYSLIVKKVVPVSSVKVAEFTKIYENIYRSVNISLVNELKMLATLMNLDIYEIIDAAKTKPFGFKAFYPGPGYGGHCIPLDPFLLSWKAKQLNFDTKFIKLSGEINTRIINLIFKMIKRVVNKKKNNKILIMGAAYKKNIDDYRESPALKIFKLLNDAKINFSYYDPYVPTVNSKYHNISNKSLKNYKNNINSYDLVVILTDHDVIDYKLIQKKSKKIIDTRGVYSFNKFKNVLSL
tara:strand:+ start:1675 stop:2964 length:1290 start_codon:yes stop_codon:yes gene_type:complete